MSHRILLFGAHGQIGQALQKYALPADWDLRALTRQDCDFLEPGSIGRVMHDYQPDLVMNAAAMTDIDACEKDRDAAKEVNFHAVANIAGQCDTLNAPLIQLSTDYVFDGTEGTRPYAVDDPMNPVNVYGQTKMMGEEAARHGLYWHVIVRTSLVFSAWGSNVLTKTLQQIETQDEVQAVSDQIANPTSAAAVAEALVVISSAILGGKGNGFGTFHVCGEPAVTRFEFLQAIMEAYGPSTDRRPRLSSVSSADIANRVPRPACTILNCDRVREVYGTTQRAWRDDLAVAVKEYVEIKARGDEKC
jgi:dTDP-4-dehydrorhamnose reductase